MQGVILCAVGSGHMKDSLYLRGLTYSDREIHMVRNQEANIWKASCTKFEELS